MFFETQPDLTKEWMSLVWEEVRRQSQFSQILAEKILFLEKEIADLKKSAVKSDSRSEFESEPVTEKLK